MNVLDSAFIILEELGTPLNYHEITKRIVEREFWKPTGLTPERTVNASLAVDIKDNGSASRFQRTAKGTFALRSWNLPEFAAQETHKQSEGSQEPENKPSTSQNGNPSVQKAQITNPSNSNKIPDIYTFTDAAEKVLEQFGQNKPMHYRDITLKALELKLLNTTGQTPEQSLYSRVLTEIERSTKRGYTPRFVKHGNGLVGLTKWLPKGLVLQIEQHNSEVRKALHNNLFSMSPVKFEELVGQLLVALGFEDVTVTSRSGDGGIDVRGVLVVGEVIKTSMAVQVKRWKNNIQSPTVQQVRGSLGTHELGLIITTSNFSAGAKQEAKRANAVPVSLMDGEQLIGLLIENEIGVHRTSYDLIDIGENSEVVG